MADAPTDSSSSAPPGPPYGPQNALLGGIPTVSVDVPISSVFLLLFVVGAVLHMTILQVNLRHKHKFIMSGLLFGFCMARIMTMIMRIVWSTRPDDIPVAIAAQVFTSAGVVLLFVINAIFAQRILRATHPNSAWHPAFGWFFRGIYTLIVLSLIMLITVTVLSFYTLDVYTRLVARNIQWYGQCVFLFVAFLPLPLVLAGLVLPRATRVEKFGSGRFRSKITILLFSATILTLGAAFRAGTNFLSPRPRDDPAWYQSKACYYCFNFVIEIIVVILYIVVRVDRRFYVPNGSKGPGDYARGQAGMGALEKHEGSGEQSLEARTTETRILSEEEVFDDIPEEQLKDDSQMDVNAVGRRV